jgi:hypothetical protein
MVWAPAIRQAAYDPETVSMLSNVLERAVAALPHPQRTQENKARLASSILTAAGRGERDPLKLYAMALGTGPWEPNGSHCRRQNPAHFRTYPHAWTMLPCQQPVAMHDSKREWHLVSDPPVRAHELRPSVHVVFPGITRPAPNRR